jgi:hypothetical protein
MSSGVDVEPMEDDPETQVEEGKEKSLAFMKRDLSDYRKRSTRKLTRKKQLKLKRNQTARVSLKESNQNDK